MKTLPHVKVEYYFFMYDRLYIVYVYFGSLLREKNNFKLQLQLDFCSIFLNQL